MIDNQLIKGYLNEDGKFDRINDPATLRRLMFTSGLINRILDCKSYWLPVNNETND